MSNGLDIRAQIDTETVRALLLINGGGIVALLSVLPGLLEHGYAQLARSILVGVLCLMLGLVSAVIHNQLRRQCSLKYEAHQMRPPKGRILGIQLNRPGVCFASVCFMWTSIAAFASGGLFIAVSGLMTMSGCHPGE